MDGLNVAVVAMFHIYHLKKNKKGCQVVSCGPAGNPVSFSHWHLSTDSYVRGTPNGLQDSDGLQFG